jgi:hypothetical protein
LFFDLRLLITPLVSLSFSSIQTISHVSIYKRVRVMVFNATFNTISAMSVVR